jgi:hypothetical protein
MHCSILQVVDFFSPGTDFVNFLAANTISLLSRSSVFVKRCCLLLLIKLHDEVPEVPTIRVSGTLLRIEEQSSAMGWVDKLGHSTTTQRDSSG